MNVNRAQALTSRPALTPIDVPEWGGTAFIRPLSVAQAFRFTAAVEGGSKGAQAFPLVVAMGCVDEHGSPIFGESDVKALEDLGLALMSRLAIAIIKVSKMGDEFDEPLQKNS